LVPVIYSRKLPGCEYGLRLLASVSLFQGNNFVVSELKVMERYCFPYEDVWYPELLGQARVERGVPSLLVLRSIIGFNVFTIFKVVFDRGKYSN
jgi:hypothetical protein